MGPQRLIVTGVLLVFGAIGAGPPVAMSPGPQVSGFPPGSCTASALRSDAPLALSLTPWTGGAVPAGASIVRYCLTVMGRAGRTVELAAAGVPKGWIASFCSGRLCQPSRMQLTIPTSRRAVVELELVSTGGRQREPSAVRIIGSDGTVTVTART